MIELRAFDLDRLTPETWEARCNVYKAKTKRQQARANKRYLEVCPKKPGFRIAKPIATLSYNPTTHWLTKVKTITASELRDKLNTLDPIRYSEMNICHMDYDHLLTEWKACHKEPVQ